MKSSFVFCLAFVHLVLFILGISCSNLGLISPIEVVEEWGCHDTEIRLTCGHLDSKLAILEATFTPNCTDDDCLTTGIKRLSGVYHTPRFFQKINDPVVMETEAARKFLETLRKSHKDDENVDENIENVESLDNDEGLVDEQMSDNNDKDLTEDDPLADTLIATKKKRTSLRASLERLIERYLKKFTPHDSPDCDMVKRSIRKKRSYSNGKGTTTAHQKFIIGARNIILNETSNYSDSERNEEAYRKLLESRGFCQEQRHRISSLDRFHLEHSYKNESREEINIRQVINRRCSGKNHCSFIFALDHPYSKVWNSGVVRIKYICMEDFRVNHYCNEHLAIGHEIDPKLTFIQPTKGEPIAEARIQLQEQSFHSLKILKSGDETESLPGFGSTYHASDSKKRKIKLDTPLESEQKQAQGVYSQDFKVLKILPNNIDSFNDIEQIGDEIFIRTDDDILNVPESELGQYRMESLPIPTALTVPILPYDPKKSKIHDNKNMNYAENLAEDNLSLRIRNSNDKNYDNDIISASINSSQDFSKFENVTLIIREGEQYVIKFPNQPIRILDNLSVNASGNIISSISASNVTAAKKPTELTEVTEETSSVSSVTSIKTLPIFETDQKQENTTMPFIQTIVRDTAPVPTISEMGLSDLSAEASNRNYKGVGIDGEYEDVRISNFYEDEDDESAENNNNNNNNDNIDVDDGDNDGIDNEDTDYNRQQNNRITYKSIQRISYRRPLLHGFSMTPGYPKFYVGDWECKSVISAPIGQKIRVTILDISLRYDEICKDFLRIVDLEYGHTLFNSCTEAVRPIEIVSESNQIEIIMKATSKFAFPKRGVLLHYSALGCIDVPPPLNGRLIQRNEKIATYECEPSFVFPDTADNKRQLSCTERHTWDKFLPDCIEKIAVIGSGIISGLNLNSHKRPSVLESSLLNSAAKMPTGAENHTSNKINEANLVTDVIVPLIIIATLFLINGIVFYYIRLHRKRQSSQEVESQELAEL